MLGHMIIASFSGFSGNLIDGSLKRICRLKDLNFRVRVLLKSAVSLKILDDPTGRRGRGSCAETKSEGDIPISVVVSF